MQSVVSGGLRLASLSLRMVLMLFLARYLSFVDIGVFSLLVGITALLPGAAGLGLSYFVNRDIVGGKARTAHLLARDRLIVTLACGIASAIGVAFLVTIGALDLDVDLRVFGVIIILEMIGFDLQLLLIARHRAALANFLLFLRTAAWVPVFMLLAFAEPALRTVEFLLHVWLGGEAACVAVAAFCLRHVFGRGTLLRPFNTEWLKRQFPRVLPIWTSDFSLAVGQNVDRFVISIVIGVEATGVYFFYFSIGSAAFQIVQSATIQPFMPRLREEFRAGVPATFHRLVAQALGRVVGFSVLIAVCAGTGTFALVMILQRAELLNALYLIVPIMSGTLAKSINEYLGIIDYVMERDLRYISMNVAALIMTTVLLAPTTWVFGLAGAAIAFLLTMSFFAAMRWTIWRKTLKPPI